MENNVENNSQNEGGVKGSYIGLIIIVLVILIGGYFLWPESTIAPISPTLTLSTSTPLINAQNTIKNFMHKIIIETNKGTIVFETYDFDAPKTVENFIILSNKGFYKDTIFHRVIKGFMIQGGDPEGTGRGGPGYQFADELNLSTESYKNGYKRGIVAMANAGPNTNGSQFFIMHKDTPLPNSYTIFGRVISGMEVVDAIANSKTDSGDRPLENIIMKKVSVEKVK